jgi:hypothetical protein
MRPDERAYEATKKREEELDRKVNQGKNLAIGIGSSLLAGGVASKVMPFINQYIPTDLALKGINKVAPKLGSFLKRGQEMGLDVEDGLKFIKDRMGKPEEEEKNIIEKYSPKIDRFIRERIAEGKDLGETLNAARKLDEDAVKRLQKDYKSDWYKIGESVYGQGKRGKGQSSQQSTPESVQNMQNQPNNAGSSANWNQIAEMLKKTLAS